MKGRCKDCSGVIRRPSFEGEDAEVFERLEPRWEASRLCWNCWSVMETAHERLAEWLGHPVFCQSCGGLLEYPTLVCSACLTREGGGG